MGITIIDHRTFWCSSFDLFENKKLQNTLEGFIGSFKQGRGVETDIRDFNGELVISHNIPNKSESKLEEVFSVYKSLDCKGKLALNIKSDGLNIKLKELLDKYNITNYFVFDMSIPDTLPYLNSNIKFYIRNSEHEINPKVSSPILYKNALGIWLDKFENTPFSVKNEALLYQYLEDGKELCLVSPELHAWGRLDNNYKKYWQIHKNIFSKLNKNVLQKVSLCTDLPTQALEFFNS